MLAGPQYDQGFAAVLNTTECAASSDPVVIPNYSTTGSNGNTFRSATAVFRDAAGQPFASLCINADVSGLTAAHACLEQLLATAHKSEQRVTEPADMELLMTEIIQASLAGVRSKNRAMNKQAKLEAVRHMQERGIFIVKGGIEKAAAALGVTRYTIYNYLDEIQKLSLSSTSANE